MLIEKKSLLFFCGQGKNTIETTATGTTRTNTRGEQFFTFFFCHQKDNKKRKEEESKKERENKEAKR